MSILTILDDSLSCTGREDCREGGREIEHMYIIMRSVYVYTCMYIYTDGNVR